MGLPSGYRRLTYIVGNGNQYIDTGLTVQKSDSWRYILEADLVSSDIYAGCNGYLQYQAKIGNGVKSEIDIVYKNVTETITVNGTQVSSQSWSSYSGTDVKIGILKLGDINNGWYNGAAQSGKIYFCKIYKSDVLVRDFVPCNNPSNVAGLYDLIGNKFYPSASSTALIAGPYTNIKTGDILNYDYTGAVQTVTLPKGIYKLECWGAQGGTGYTRVGTSSTNTYYTLITSNNYSSYFTITSGTYEFTPDSSGNWSANNLGLDRTTASTTWTCNSSGTYRLTWTYVTEQRYDKLTIEANGTTYANAVSGNSSGTATVELSNGATIEATYKKDSSQSASGEKAVLKIEKQQTNTTWSYGSATSYSGGKGGYSIGTLTLKNPSTLYIRSGGQGSSNNTTSSNVTVSGGFNGGGNSKSGYYHDGFTTGGGGGGASDVRIDTDDLYSRVIVAGGGGGAAGANDSSKYGGGVSGGSPVSGYAASATAAGTNGSFGTGGNHTASYNYKYRPRGGGGGWYGGGCATSSSDSNADTTRGSNGGGSGYVYTSSTASNYPSGCKLNSTHYLTNAATYAGNTSFTSTSGSNETGHSGNGYVRITVIKIDTINIPCKINGTWKTGDTVKAKINGAWKNVEATYVKIGGVWK